MLIKNNLIEKLKSGKPVIGTWNTLASPLVTEVIANWGLDFQIIDLEHGPFGIDKIHLHVSACENSKCTPLVRVPSNSHWMSLQALDQGAHGIIVPHIDSVANTRDVINNTKYFPEGSRGFTPFSKAGGFNNLNTSKYADLANKETINIVIIESLIGLDNLEDILEVDTVDVVYFGAYDLSQALGYPGQINHHEVKVAIQEGVDRVNKSGKYAGGFVPQNKESIYELLEMGMKFITYEVDSSIIYKQMNDIYSWFSKL